MEGISYFDETIGARGGPMDPMNKSFWNNLVSLGIATFVMPNKHDYLQKAMKLGWKGCTDS